MGLIVARRFAFTPGNEYIHANNKMRYLDGPGFCFPLSILKESQTFFIFFDRFSLCRGSVGV